MYLASSACSCPAASHSIWRLAVSFQISRCEPRPARPASGLTSASAVLRNGRRPTHSTANQANVTKRSVRMRVNFSLLVDRVSRALRSWGRIGRFGEHRRTRRIQLRKLRGGHAGISRRFKVRIYPRTVIAASASGTRGQQGTTQDIPHLFATAFSLSGLLARGHEPGEAQEPAAAARAQKSTGDHRGSPVFWEGINEWCGDD